MSREQLSKMLRFEVFKRDCFKCQYCGAEAPGAVLHVDHIEPVAKGGTNEITNLITSCEPCNNGKSDRLLSDNAAVEKARTQLEELQERREQLEMMMEWRKGMRTITDDAVAGLVSYWEHYTPGFSIAATGRTKLAGLMEKFSVGEICAAMDVTARANLKFDEKGKPTPESVETAFVKIVGICRVTRASETDPDLKQLYYIRGILRNRIPGYFDAPKAMEYLKAARSWGVEMEELQEIALTIRNWSQFRSAIANGIERVKAAAGGN
jgi:hypothetical protein